RARRRPRATALPSQSRLHGSLSLPAGLAPDRQLLRRVCVPGTRVRTVRRIGLHPRLRRGSPNRARFEHMTVPFLDVRAAHRELADALSNDFIRVMTSGRYILGAELEAFEHEFALRCGARHAVGVGNGLDALSIALRSRGIGPGDEVIVPTHT